MLFCSEWLNTIVDYYFPLTHHKEYFITDKSLNSWVLFEVMDSSLGVGKTGQKIKFNVLFNFTISKQYITVLNIYYTMATGVTVHNQQGELKNCNDNLTRRNEVPVNWANAEDIVPFTPWKNHTKLCFKYFLWGFFFVLYSTLLHLPPLKFHCADGCWDRTQDSCNWCIDSQTL